MGGENKGWPTGPLTDTAPGAVYLQAMADSRKLAWHAANVVYPPFDRVIILAKPREGGRGWFTARAIWDGTAWCDPEARDVRYSAAWVTHWHEDTIGTP